MSELLELVATLRFEIRLEKARRMPYRVFDRLSNRSVGQFLSKEDADNFLNTQRTQFIERTLHAFNTTGRIPCLENE